MPYLIECLKGIEKGSCTVLTCAYIYTYSFDDAIYLFYGCVLMLEAKLMVGDYFCFSIITESLGSRSFLNNFDRTCSTLIGLYNSASFAGLPGFMMICAIFH